MSARDVDPRRIAAQLRDVAAMFDRGEGYAASADPEVDALLFIYRAACPLIAARLRARAGGPPLISPSEPSTTAPVGRRVLSLTTRTDPYPEDRA